MRAQKVLLDKLVLPRIQKKYYWTNSDCQAQARPASTMEERSLTEMHLSERIRNYWTHQILVTRKITKEFTRGSKLASTTVGLHCHQYYRRKTLRTNIQNVHTMLINLKVNFCPPESIPSCMACLIIHLLEPFTWSYVHGVLCTWGEEVASGAMSTGVAARLEQVLQSQQEKGLLMLHLWNLNVVKKLCPILEFKKQHFKTCEGGKQHMYITEKNEQKRKL